MIAAGQTKEFKTAFGDRFTQALHTGGELHALVRVTSSDVRHQQRISASLHAELNGLFTSASFKGSLQTAQQDTSSHTEVDIQIHQTGGVGAQVQIPGTDANRIREHMNRFATAAHQNAAAYQAELVSYDILALPFPSLEELEERRRVLEDCLARRQRYWSAISDLTFAQSEDADLIFEDLPSREQLVALQNAFRGSLNRLMSHARAVSRGSVAPTLFVDESEPVLPHFKRRRASRFAVWWARRHDSTLLRDEKTLITRIAEAVELEGQLTVPPEEASPETIERAADMLRRLWISSHQPLRSLAALPSMIDAPLRDVIGTGNVFENLTGLEPFSRLERLDCDLGSLRDIEALTSAAGLRWLNLTQNQIEDLSPLRALTGLEILVVPDNRIRSLEPLRELRALRLVFIARNPIVAARALENLPRLTNPLASSDQMRISLFHPDGARIQAGTAQRIGDSNRFQFTADSGLSEQIVITGLLEWDNLDLFSTPVAVSAIDFHSAGAGAACTRPDDRSTSLPISETIRLFAHEKDVWLSGARSALFELACLPESFFGAGPDDPEAPFQCSEPDVFVDVELI